MSSDATNNDAGDTMSNAATSDIPRDLPPSLATPSARRCSSC